MTDESRTTVSTKDESAAQICIGGRVLSSRFFLAPLAGYTHLAFRTAIRELGGMGLATTDLVLADQLVHGGKKSRQLVSTSPADRPLSVQIFGSRAESLVAAARWLEENGYEGVDINMGCPMAKINSAGGGARMMCNVEEAQRTISAVVNAVDLPVTVKMRLGWDRNTITAPILARACEQVGVAAVTLHGRTRCQGFHGDVHLGSIRKTVEAVDCMPIIGNGDVRSVADAQRMRKETGCAAVAIGRGAMMDPWIFRKLAGAVRGNGSADEPTAEEKIAFLVRHFTLMTEQHGDYSCVLFRKFSGWYGAKLGIPEDLENRLRRMKSFSEFDRIVSEIRLRPGERETTTPTALVKVPNGPVERW